MTPPPTLSHRDPTHDRSAAGDDENRRILIIDDDPGVRQAYDDILSTTAPQEVFTQGAQLFGEEPTQKKTVPQTTFELSMVESGLKGIQAVKESLDRQAPFAMAFIDMKMYGMDGVETTRNIWSLDPTLKVVIVTAFSEFTPDEIITALGREDIFYLRKPFNGEEIKQFARALTRTWNLERDREGLSMRLRDTNNALIAEKEKIETVLRTVMDGVLVTNEKGCIHLINPAGVALLELPDSEVLGASLEQVVPDKALALWIKKSFEEAAHQEDYQQEIPGEKRPRSLRIRSVILPGPEEGIHERVSIVYDITEETESGRMKSEFISTAAHELRTPLTSIQGYSEILLNRKDLEESERFRFLEYIYRQSVELSKIVTDLLDLSRLEAGFDMVLNRSECVAGEAIRSTVPLFKPTSEIHHFEVQVSPDNITLYVDKEKMGQVMKNLMGNAVKYSPKGGIIEVGSGVEQEDYHVWVRDEGQGMTPDQVSHVFNKFYRADMTNAAPMGTGLGMTIVKHIIEAHNGRIWVESALGVGTTVHFTLPVYNADPKGTKEA
ncbi:ATP-binding protein [Desulfoluna sp.]|uniref:ATP-binding response regulator n=1 Tax=Desulfoluna sp. TaxID=2045199 RepID=UPI0026258BD9|nr:ATP-binding protein [Desulfoluna sp.]